MKKEATPAYDLDIGAVAKRFNVGRMTVWQWANKRQIAYTKIGRSMRFSEQDVEEFLQRGRVEYEPKIAVTEAVTA